MSKHGGSAYAFGDDMETSQNGWLSADMEMAAIDFKSKQVKSPQKSLKMAHFESEEGPRVVAVDLSKDEGDGHLQE